MQIDYVLRHIDALEHPTEQERPLVLLITGLQLCAPQLGSDMVLREGVARIIDGTTELLNASWGDRLDRGMLYSELDRLASGMHYDMGVQEFSA